MVTAGGGRVSPISATTDANGRAQTVFTLGGEIGDNTVTARVTGLADSVTFKATAQMRRCMLTRHSVLQCTG